MLAWPKIRAPVLSRLTLHTRDGCSIPLGHSAGFLDILGGDAKRQHCIHAERDGLFVLWPRSSSISFRTVSSPTGQKTATLHKARAPRAYLFAVISAAVPTGKAPKEQGWAVIPRKAPQSGSYPSRTAPRPLCVRAAQGFRTNVPAGPGARAYACVAAAAAAGIFGLHRGTSHAATRTHTVCPLRQAASALRACAHAAAHVCPL
jgi:hypothetical protein